MIEKGINWYAQLLAGTGLSDGILVFIENATIIVVTIVLAILADFIVKRIIISSIARLAKRSKNDWDDVFVKQKVFNRLAHLAPALIIYYALQYIFDATDLVKFLGNLTQTYMILMVLLVIDSVLNALLEIYMKLPISKGRNIKGFIQVVKIIFYFIAIILIISAFSEEPPGH
jgi:miniconductance mechanosensitive channel